MIRFRFSIAGLLLVVLFIGIAIAALRASTDAWDSGILGSTTLILLTAVLLSIHRTERRRAYWLGFALFGWIYLAASLVPPVESRLPTTRGLAFLDSKVPGREETHTAIFAYTRTARSAGPNAVQTLAFSPQGHTLAISSQGAIRLWDSTTGKLLAGPGGSTENFLRIGHSLLALLLALLGGHWSRFLYGQGRGPAAVDQAGTSPPEAVGPGAIG